MFEKKVIPFLKKITAEKEIFLTKTFRTIGIRESVVDTKLKKILTGIKGLAYGLSAHPYQVDIRLSCRAKTKNEAKKIIARGEKILFKHLAKLIFTADDRPLEEVVGTLLRDKKMTIALAESCTGGLISNRITDVSGSSDYFLGAMVVYSNQWKNNFLDVPEKILKKYGAVSPQTAKSMAANVRIKSRTDLGLAVTGIAGPTGGTAQKPVGLVYIALADKNKTWCWKHNFRGNRLMIKTLTSQAALNHLREHLVKK